MDAGKLIFRCTDCGQEYPGHTFMYLCPACETGNRAWLPPKGVLKTVYNYRRIGEGKDSGLLAAQLQKSRYLELLPIQHLKSLPRLKVGNTPVYNVSQHFHLEGMQLFVKDDSQNPTYSFKDRASALVSAYAREKEITTIVAASTGNAGSSLAGICASQGQKAIVFVPAKAPMAKLTQILMYGAKLVPVDGTYDQAFDLSMEVSKEFGFFNRNTAFNPFTIEGKKTVAFELFEQFVGKMPARIFVPVGDGVIISGVYKGFEDLLKLGLIETMPEIVGVQAAGSNNLASNFQKATFAIKPGVTCADSIAVDIPRNFYMACQFVDKYNGRFIEVSDEEILEASTLLSRNTGLFAEPASAASLAGFLKMKMQNSIPEKSTNLLLLTGSGLKDLKAVQSSIKLAEPISATLQEAKKILEL
ncbi:MAG TPA: threonine synthase [Marinilabiliales bacterium]|jgi:threonine synthase|nr:threonine synthase [Marinilabiliales bacterium]